MNATFKVGDRVRVNAPYVAAHGRTGTVDHVHLDNVAFPIDVKVDDTDDGLRFYNAAELERLDGAA